MIVCSQDGREVPQTLQPFSGAGQRLARVAPKAVQSMITLGTNDPHDGVGAAFVRCRHDWRACSLNRTAPYRRDAGPWRGIHPEHDQSIVPGLVWTRSAVTRQSDEHAVT